jgi:hypothetical protein
VEGADLDRLEARQCRSDDLGGSCRLADVPSARATWLEAVTSVDWVTFRELATTLKPRSTNPFTIPAPIPCEAPVTMAVRGPFIVVS